MTRGDIDDKLHPSFLHTKRETWHIRAADMLGQDNASDDDGYYLCFHPRNMTTTHFIHTARQVPGIINTSSDADPSPKSR